MAFQGSVCSQIRIWIHLEAKTIRTNFKLLWREVSWNPLEEGLPA